MEWDALWGLDQREAAAVGLRRGQGGGPRMNVEPGILFIVLQRKALQQSTGVSRELPDRLQVSFCFLTRVAQHLR